MDDVPLSDDSAAALTGLADVINRIEAAAHVRDELVVAIRSLIEARVADAVEALADRVQNSTDILP